MDKAALALFAFIGFMCLMLLMFIISYLIQIRQGQKGIDDESKARSEFNKCWLLCLLPSLVVAALVIMLGMRI